MVQTARRPQVWLSGTLGGLRLLEGLGLEGLGRSNSWLQGGSGQRGGIAAARVGWRGRICEGRGRKGCCPGGMPFCEGPGQGRTVVGVGSVHPSGFGQRGRRLLGFKLGRKGSRLAAGRMAMQAMRQRVSQRAGGVISAFAGRVWDGQSGLWQDAPVCRHTGQGSKEQSWSVWEKRRGVGGRNNSLRLDLACAPFNHPFAGGSQAGSQDGCSR